MSESEDATVSYVDKPDDGENGETDRSRGLLWPLVTAGLRIVGLLLIAGGAFTLLAYGGIQVPDMIVEEGSLEGGLLLIVTGLVLSGRALLARKLIDVLEPLVVLVKRRWRGPQSKVESEEEGD